MKIFASLSELGEAAGLDLGVTDWMTIDQDRVNGFAEVALDPQWIHIDEVAAATSVYGGTIAHGFLTLSLVPSMLRRLYRVDGARMAVNYGLDKVRFPQATRVGSRIRCAASIAAVVPLENAVQVTFTATITAEDAQKPSCVASYIIRFMG